MPRCTSPLRILPLLICLTAAGTGLQVNFNMPEELPDGSLVGSLVSPDAPAEGVVSFGVIPNKGERQSGAEYFKVDKSGDVRVQRRVDRDSLERCARIYACYLTFQVLRFGGLSQMPTTVDVTVNVLDVNDNSPSWRRGSLETRLDEDFQAGRTFTVEAARDPDLGVNGTIEYELLDPSGTFSVLGGSSGSGGVGGSGGTGISIGGEQFGVQIVVNKPLDREQTEVYNLTLLARDHGQERRSASAPLRVVIEDLNDHAPVFNQTLYRVQVSENTRYDQMLLQLHASDPDKGRNGEVEYEFAETINQRVRGYFRLDRQLGRLHLKQSLDYESAEARSFEFTVVAKDRAANPKWSTAQVEIVVVDENDCAPLFTVYQFSQQLGLMQETMKLYVAENTEPHSFLGVASVTDADSGPGGEADCEIPIPMAEFFRLQTRPDKAEARQKTYHIMNQERLDRERRESYKVTVICRDHGRPQQTSTFILTIEVLDANDEPPVFSMVSYDFDIRENLPAETRVGLVQATDKDANHNKRISYNLAPSDDAALFRIKPAGEILTAAPLDRETKGELRLIVIARDHGDPPLNASAFVIIRVQDDNDLEPRFSQEEYTFEIFENEPPDSPVGMLNATDGDTGANSQMHFSIQPLTAQHLPFRIAILQPGQVQIRTTEQLNRESPELQLATDGPDRYYAFRVRVSDRGNRPLTSQAAVRVIVRDRNDNSPAWIVPSEQLRAVNISSQEEVSRVVVNLRAIDPDEGDAGRIRYAIESGDTDGLFALDPNEGSLQVRRRLPRTGQYNLTLMAWDSPAAGGNASRGSRAVLTINVVEQPRDANRVTGTRHGGGGDGASPQHPGDGVNEKVIVGLVSCTLAVALLAIAVILGARCFLIRLAETSAKRAKRQSAAEEAVGQEALLFTGPGPVLPVLAEGTSLRRPELRGRQCTLLQKDGSIDGSVNASGEGCNTYQVATLSHKDRHWQTASKHHRGSGGHQKQHQAQHQQYTSLTQAAPAGTTGRCGVPRGYPTAAAVAQYYDLVKESNSAGDLTVASGSSKAAAAAATAATPPAAASRSATVGGRFQAPLYQQASSFV